MPDAASLYQTIGLAGFLCYMAGFAGLQMGRIDGNGAVYIWTNIIGATLVLISLTHAFNLASLLIQVSWIVIGFGGLLRRANTRPIQTRALRHSAQAPRARLDRGVPVL